MATGSLLVLILGSHTTIIVIAKYYSHKTQSSGSVYTRRNHNDVLRNEGEEAYALSEVEMFLLLCQTSVHTI